MRQVGNVEIPQKAFMSVLKLDERPVKARKASCLFLKSFTVVIIYLITMTMTFLNFLRHTAYMPLTVFSSTHG